MCVIPLQYCLMIILGGLKSKGALNLLLDLRRMHNLAHVELNAIDLAWDTVARFSALGLDEVRPRMQPGVTGQSMSLLLH